MPLPPGLILNPATGELSGTPTVPGTFAIQLKVRDVLGSSRELVDEVTINPYTPMSWSGNLGNMMATRPATGVTVARAGGLAPYVYSVFSGALPAGLSLNASTGVISGTPTDAGGYAFTLRVVDALSQHADYVLAGTVAVNLVADASGMEVRGTVSVPYDEPVAVSGGTAPYAYSLASGALPGGLSWVLGEVRGTPTAPSTAAAVLRVTDANGFTADTATINFDITAYPTISGALPRGMVGKAYSSSALAGSSGHTPYAWSAFGLPPGLSINAGTGAVTGTPTTAGQFDAEIDFTDVLLVQASKSQVMEIAAALAISGGYLANVTRGNLYPTFTPSVVGGYPAYSFAISVGALPPGLSLNASTGVISGTPTTQGVYTATLRVTDADGSTATMAFNVNVAGDLSMTGTVANYGTTTVAYSGDNLGSSGGTAPYSWSIAAGALPPGITMNTGTGDLSGTPTTPGTYNFTVRVTDANASFAQTAFTITVAEYPSLSGQLPDGTVGVAYSAKYSAAGGHAPLAYDIAAGTLPTGLSINGSDGTISGTPSAAGDFPFTVRVTDAKGNVVTRAGNGVSGNVHIYADVSLSGSLTSPTEAGLAYSDSLTASGGKPPIAWSVLGTLPPGLTINSGTGLISGSVGGVTADTTYSFTVRAVDALGRVFGQPTSIVVKRRVAHDTNAGPAQYPVRTIAYSSAFVAQYGVSPYSYSLVGGAFPTGLSMNAAGTVSGTPTVAGNFSVTVRATDALGATVDRAFTFTVLQPMAISGTPGNSTVGVAYSFTPTASGGLAPYEYFLTAGSIPPGCSFNSTTGRVSGTPTAAGTYNFTITVYSNTHNDSAALATSITVNAFPTLSLTYPRGMVGKAYTGSVSTSGGWTPKTYARVAGAFPTGLSLNGSTGALTGTPTAAGIFTGTVRMTDAMGNIVDKTFSIQIAEALNILSTYAPAYQNVAYDSTVGASGGYSPYTYSLVSGAVPTGTTRSGSRVFGTPTVAAAFNFTMRATDQDGSTFDKAFTITVVAASFSVSASPNPASDYAFSGGTSVVNVSASSTATPAGGNAPFTYAWAIVTANGSAGRFAFSGQNTRTLTVSASGSAAYLRNELWRCTVTDSLGNQRTTDVTFELQIDDGGGGGDPGCPDAECVLPCGRRVGDLKVGDLVECVDVVTGERFLRDVRHISTSIQPRMRLHAENGGTITQSESTRMTLRDGREVLTGDMQGEELLGYDGRFVKVVRVEALEPGLCVNVNLGNVMFFAGDADGVMFATHNLKPA